MKRLVLVATLAVALVACGSSGTKSSSGSSSGGSSTTSTTEGLPKDAGEKAIVQSGTLKLSDLPAGWNMKPKDTSSNSSLDAKLEKIPECAQVKRLTEGKANGKASSPDFKAGSDAETSNEVEIYKNGAAVDAVMAVIPAAGTVTCFRKALQAGIDEGLKKDPQTAAAVKNVTVTGGPITAGTYGDKTVGIGYQVMIDVGTQTVGLYFDLVAVKLGPTLTTYQFQDSQPSPLGALRPQIIQATLARLRAAGA